MQNVNLGILAIGTELTTGQIVNSNGAWISKQIQRYRLSTAIETTVPDDRKVILASLDDISRNIDLLFVLGGLGPTNDDITRAVVAEWVKRPLIFSEIAWQEVQARLSKRNVAVRDIQKRVCQFPENAEILFNRNGTAHGFKVVHPRSSDKKLIIYVLPGPPVELQGIFEDHIASQLERDFGLTQTELHLWQCLGKPESEIAEISEKWITSPELLLGYRLHRPFVELKLWAPKNMTPEQIEQIVQMEKELRPHVFCDGDLNYGADFLNLLKNSNSDFPIYFCDESEGLLAAEYVMSATQNEALRSLRNRIIFLTNPALIGEVGPTGKTGLEFCFSSQGGPVATLESPKGRFETHFSEWRSKFPWEIYRRAYLEGALKFWLETLTGN